MMQVIKQIPMVTSIELNVDGRDPRHDAMPRLVSH